MLRSVSDVRDRIALLCDAESEPKIRPDEIDTFMEMARRVDLYGNTPDSFPEWEPAITYGVGEQAVPSAKATGAPTTPLERNGYFYTCTVAGKSGAAEPAWPTTVGDTVVDGTVTWQCAGQAPWNPTYDVNYAIAQAWLLKSGRLVGHYNFMTAGKMFSREQFYNHCMDQYKRYSNKSGLKAIRLGEHAPLQSMPGAVETNAS